MMSRTLAATVLELSPFSFTLLHTLSRSIRRSSYRQRAQDFPLLHYTTTLHCYHHSFRSYRHRTHQRINGGVVAVAAVGMQEMIIGKTDDQWSALDKRKDNDFPARCCRVLEGTFHRTLRLSRLSPFSKIQLVHTLFFVLTVGATSLPEDLVFSHKRGSRCLLLATAVVGG